MAKKKKMSWDIPVDEMWEKFEAAVKGETPRGMAMVHGALIEDALMRLLKSYLVAGDATDALLDGFNSPVGTWSARTLLAYSVGLISEDERDAVDLLRAIRNMFAHSMSADYDDPAVAKKLRDLTERLGGERFIPLDKQYQMLVSFLAASFFNRVSQVGPHPDQISPLALQPSSTRRPLDPPRVKPSGMRAARPNSS